MLCNVMDDSCGMLINILQHNIGLEYELTLHEVHDISHHIILSFTHQCLRAAGVPFQTEDKLRQNNAAKTPDVKLDAPAEVVFHTSIHSLSDDSSTAL